MTFHRSSVVRGIVVSVVAIVPQACVDDAATGPMDGADAAPMDAGTDTSTAMDAMVADVNQTDTATDAGPPGPKAIAGANLQLWLTGDKDVTCSSGRVTTWKDQAAFHRNATESIATKGPQCGVSMHAINGVNVPWFDAPVPTNPGDYRDGTMNVPISFLDSAPSYTIFVVERRWQDPSTVGAFRPAGLFFGSEPSVARTGACPTDANIALQLGYVGDNMVVQLTFDQACNNVRSPALSLLLAAPAALTLDMAIFDDAVGRKLVVNGVQVGLGAGATDKNPLANTAANIGTLGRALLHDTDARFRGDIAELIVFNKALTTAEQHAVETYAQAHWAFAF